jgi:origin recognition complex subunit 3
MAISADLFQEKLSRNTVRQLRGASFESRSATEILDILFSAAVWGHDEHSLWIGAQVSRLLLDRQTEHIASAKGFIAALKVRELEMGWGIS